MTRAQLTALLALAAASWGAWLLFAGLAVGVDYLKPFSLVIAVQVAAVTLFNLFLWKWPGVRQLLADRPLVVGGWRIQLESTYKDEGTGEPKKIEAFYLVRQTYLHVSIRMFTSETTSKTEAAQFVKSEDGEWVLHGTFLDTPDIKHRSRSSVHFGAFLLRLSGNPVTGLSGQYWTDRGTSGMVRSIAHLPSAEFDSFESAKAAFAESGGG